MFCVKNRGRNCSGEISEVLVSHLNKHLKFTIKAVFKFYSYMQSSNFKIFFVVKNSMNSAKPETIRKCFKYLSDDDELTGRQG